MRKYDRIEEILKTHREQFLDPEEKNSAGIERAVKCIQKNIFAKELTVKWLKEQCHINGGSFATKFAQRTGYYPKEYILYHRIQVAKRLLKETDVTITLIAVSVGFNSLSAFCKTFKSKEKMKPSEWRNNFANSGKS